ncbi:MAG: substrate-binding domain-containing protein [Verrucomicrobia bacterium]|nr:substrate-binding domain-containing protein [Verrucomicrobiota bacterium]MCH8513171.1 substrate-binding domain-containing protein [Kiritimatiellia bacterium]
MSMQSIRIHCDLKLGWRFGRDVFNGILEARQVGRWNWGMTCDLWKIDEVWSLPPDQEPQGVIGSFNHPAKIREWLKWDIPIVNVSDLRFEHPRVHTVTADNLVIGRMAADNLLERGFQSFGLVTDPAIPAATHRGNSFKEMVSTRSPVREHAWSFLEEMGRFLKDLPLLTGIFCPTDTIARYVVTSLIRLGRHVPEEFAVIGVDDDPIQIGLSPVPLTSMDIRPREIGRIAAETLHDLLEGRPRPETVTVSPGGIITRQSSDLFAISDPAVITVLRRIRTMATDHVRTADVLRPSDGARRTLERKFRTLLGRSIEEEIRRQRIEFAREMLMNTRLSVEEVAEKCGFANAPHFSRSFKKALGLSPGAFRSKAH